MLTTYIQCDSCGSESLTHAVSASDCIKQCDTGKVRQIARCNALTSAGEMCKIAR
ncbi:hypothetical protein LOK49_LG03G01531 [Camellia lanceoleosa]|uniref:Uncharacterized protein n=1 Tax=Camellia lanceoleosa TaxID=1840588 RepID=A0ACC0ICZ6_9ERIC|nr:hypothetical protein LOK49_LG03G01531 [Camellia lanceoleosa]